MIFLSSSYRSLLLLCSGCYLCGIMPKQIGVKRYYSGHSDSESNKAKQCKQRSPSDDFSFSVSEVLS